MRKQLLVAFSLANLCFFNAWREVLSPQAFSYLYYWKQNPAAPALAALVFNVWLLTAVFFTSYRLAIRFGGSTFQTVSRGVFLLIFLRALNSVRLQFESLGTRELRLQFGRIGFFAIELLLFALFIFVVTHYGLNRVARGAALTALVLSPFGLVGLAQATWLTLRYGQPIGRERQPAPTLEAGVPGRPRVLWLIFDEMDERLAFAERPADLSLPEFDRLRSEALFATNAFPPAGHTSQSIPSLLTGQLISAVKPSGPGELLLTLPARETTTGWSSQPDIFSDARAGGFNTALVGWFHPYCRVIGDRLNFCHWEAASQRIDTAKLSLKRNLLRQEIGLLNLLPSAGRYANALQSRQSQISLETYRSGHLADYRALLPLAESVAADREFGLTFIHLPVPHPPDIYDRARMDFTTTKESTYLDNLALADRTLGELRRKMEQAGLWESTTVVLSSDHWWRADYWEPGIFWTAGDDANRGEKVEHRVPFLVKLAGQKAALTYDAPFNTVLTHDLILDVLNGKLARPDEAAAWLDAHRTIGESPYQNYDDAE
jgi:hypothetical protein